MHMLRTTVPSYCISFVTAPATLNGDVISKAQFEALQHAMKQLEVSKTQACIHLLSTCVAKT